MTINMEPRWKEVSVTTQLPVIQEMIRNRRRREYAAAGVRNNNIVLQEMISDAFAPKGGLYECPFDEGVSIQEMLTTSQGQMGLLQKVRIDVAFGLAEVPLLYQPIYERIDGPFPGGTFQIDENTVQGNVVFAQKFEAGEVQFGTLAKGAPSVGKIQTYAAGFEWTEDMIEFDQTWSIELNNRAFGRNYNYLLNHLHLSPIIGGTFTGGNATAASAVGTGITEHTANTFRDAYIASLQARPQRTATLLLASESDRFVIEDALLTPVYDANGRPLSRVPIDTIIYYDGAVVVRGQESTTYPGVTAGTCFLIFPQRRFKELVHHDLRIDIGPPDLTRLIEGQQVARARRGIYADLQNSVQKITLPTS